MPSPDQSGYSTLTLYDKGPFELIAKAIQDASVKVPDWEPRVGALEYVIWEALALEGSELIYAINRVPNGIMEILMGIFGVVRDLGSESVATVTFTVADTTGAEIPAGTLVRLTPLSGDSVEFSTDTSLVIAAGSSTGTVAVTATTPTSGANGTPIGTALEMVTVVAFVDSVVLASVPSGGADAETDDEWRDRAVTRIGRFSDTLVLPQNFIDRALEEATVGRATAKDNWNVSTSETGHITLAVADVSGVALSNPQKADVQTVLAAQAMAGLGIHIVDPSYTAVTIAATVTRLASADGTQVHADCVAALADYLSPATWGWGSKVRLNEIISLLDRVDGVDWVGAVTINTVAADLTLSGNFPLVTSGTHAVTVSAP